MAYNTEQLKQRAIQLINDKKLLFITDIYTLLGIASSTFYEHFPSNSSDYIEMDNLLQMNKSDIKTSLRSKWYQSPNPALQITLMKLVATAEERKLMSQSYVDIESGGEKIKSGINLEAMSLDALVELKNALSPDEDIDNVE